ncbi:ribosome biogenesis GTP-binding protein YihA/YsxC [Gammaproteobacteria bacterium]|nr:ribosome biogenesis GTP-binding protein YihA/YsxC [Gammaproteobacteria bacterium]
MSLNFKSVQFLTSATKVSECPTDLGSEVVFCGRSNAGKSSAINALTGNRGLARISKTPGRTQMINFFSVSCENRIVDLPGYGYARVSSAISATWRENLESYLCFRRSLKGVILLMDIRNPLKDSDKMMITWLSSIDLPIHVLLTKSDKLSKSGRSGELRRVSKDLGEKISCQLFSSKSREGVSDLEKALAHWLS